MENSGVWLSVNEYSSRSGISITTIRRYIKNKRLKYVKNKGKYFIYSEGPSEMSSRDKIKLISRIKDLEAENIELKMLIDLYEKGHIARKECK